MSIDRPDWGAGGERGSGTAVTVHSGPYTELPSHDEVTTAIELGLPPTPQQQAAFAEFNKDLVPAKRARDPETGRYVTRADWNLDRQGREIATASDFGLPPILSATCTRRLMV